MACESIYNNIQIKTKAQAEKFVNALEASESKASATKKPQVSFTEVKGKKIKDMFKDL